MLGLGNALTGGVALGCPGASCYSMSFDGSGDFLSFTETTFDIEDTNDELSISFWAKRDGTGSQDSVLSNVNGYYRRIYFPDDGDELWMEGDSNGQEAKASVTADTNWHHYVITLVGSSGSPATVVMYEDGSALTVTNSNLGATDNKDFTISRMGMDTATDNAFDGLLYQVEAAEVGAIYNGGTPIDVAANDGSYVSSGDLIHLWNFDEGSGSTAADSAGSLNATITNATYSSLTP